MEYNNCLICNKEKATKTNSHLIPSFMIAKVCSYDGSGKRDKEVMFTMTSYEDKVFVGAVPDTKLDELFNQEKLTDERINQELKNNTASKDYIFCPKCEANLSKYLETPYAEHYSKGKSIQSDIAYFFWLSIVWRMAVSRQFQFALPEDIELNLGECLNEYIEAVANNQDVTPIIEKCEFSYRLLRSPSYLPNGLAYLCGRYKEETKTLTLTLGDTILCANFDKQNIELLNDYTYLGLEDVIKSAPVNTGTNSQQCVNVENKTFEDAMKQMVKEMAFKRLLNEKELADKIWNVVGLSGNMPDEIFQSFMERLYSEEVKQGDKKTVERYVQVFNDTLESFGFSGQ